MSRELRFDFFSLGKKVKTTQQGFLRIPATFTRVGVVEYRTPNGSIRKEFRPPEEVLRQDSIDTLSGIPLTIDHPGMVNPENVKDFSVGVSNDKVDKNGNKVDGSVTIQRQDAIDGVKNGGLKEMSPGYTCSIDPTPGEYQGERYDAVQRNIVYNHIGLGPKGWGRQGNEVALRFDSKENPCAVSVEEIEEPKTKKETVKMAKLQIKLDGISYEIELADALKATFEDSVLKLTQSREDSKNQISKLEGELTAEKKAKSELQEKFDGMSKPEAIDQLVAQRVDLIENAKKLHKEIKADGKTDKEIKIEALVEGAKFDRETFDSKDEGFVDGVFTAALSNHKEEVEPKAKGVGISPAPVEREDSADDVYDSEKARQRMIEHNQKLGQEPLK